MDDGLHDEVAAIIGRVLRRERGVRPLVYESSYSGMREEPSGRGRPGDIPFGNRHLTDGRDVFEHNAWDNMPWDEEMEAEARAIVEKQKANRVDPEKARRLLDEPADQWDDFYSQHTNKFFMDRNWLLKEFPELDTSAAQGPVRALEVGCGVGNTTFPILELDKENKMFLYSCDFSPKAVEVLKANEKFDSQRCSGFVWDITQPPPAEAPEPGTIDLVVCIYVLSAIEPSKLPQTLKHLLSLLRPGGALLLKDYGRFDLTQLRFKADRLIADNLYCRGDGTLVYFFDPEELDASLCEAGFVKEANVVDRRLIVNRAKRVKMQRNKKKLLRLCAETLKFRAVFDAMLDDKDLVVSLMHDESNTLGGDLNYLYVCLYEFLVGAGIKEMPNHVSRLFTRLANDIHARERTLAQEGRGIESARVAKDQREKGLVMPRYARINTLKWSEEEALASLQGEDWKVVELASGESFIDRVQALKNDEVLIDPHVRCLLIFAHATDFHTYWMVEQRYLILQDKASCLPAFLLDPPQDAHVVDACAAPGMKTSHLAALLNNTGKIFAWDRSEDRAYVMKDMLHSAEATNAVVLCADFLQVDTRDRKYSQVRHALVDPPCSGSGIVKRMDEWIDAGEGKTGIDFGRLSKLANLQAMLLKHAMSLPSLQKVVYSTCSIHEEENEMVVAEVLKDVPSFRVVSNVLPEWEERGRDGYEFGKDCLRADPRKTATNGFFVTVFERVSATAAKAAGGAKERRIEQKKMKKKEQAKAKAAEAPKQEAGGEVEEPVEKVEKKANGAPAVQGKKRKAEEAPAAKADEPAKKKKKNKKKNKKAKGGQPKEDEGTVIIQPLIVVPKVQKA